MKNILSKTLILLFLFILSGYVHTHYYGLGKTIYKGDQFGIAIDPKPKAIPGGHSDLGPDGPNDPAFFDLNYSQDNTDSLMEGELIVTTTYPKNPCGTLMTQFSKRGSARVGRGPVYSSALEKCRAIDEELVPNDFSFRTVACKNVGDNDSIRGQATFAFLCGLPGDSVQCSEQRIHGSEGTYKTDWNCSGIKDKKKPCNLR